jgi:GT2 family glycosyltransferase
MINIITASIVLFHNDKAILQEAVDSFLSTNLSVKLFLIDNSKTDLLKSLKSDSRIEYLHNPSNPGFGASHNIALNKASLLGAKYHLVLNPDVKFEKGTIDRITQYMNENPEIGNLMPKVYYLNGEIQYLCKLLPTPYDWIGRRFNPFRKMVNKRNNNFELRFSGYDKIMEVPYLSGCFMFLSMEAVSEIGVFDEKIFMYGEDTDLCRRLINRGYKNIFYPEANIQHVFEKGSHKSIRLTWVGIKSAIYYFNKWGWFFDSERNRINRNCLKNIV